MNPLRLSLLLAVLAVILPLSAPPEAAETLQGMAMHGPTKYKPGFSHFDYVNPDAPKGGTLRLAAIGSFDSLNPFILKGVAAGPVSMTFDTLLVRSADEPFSAYGLVAESMEVPEDRSWVIFNLRKEARFHDKSPITADDVIFSFNILKDKGAPFFRAYYQSVASVEKLSDHKVRFIFVAGQNRELPLIVGELPILSKAYWQNRNFAETTLEAPLGSGPYAVASVEPGRSIVLARTADYWGKDLPVNRGLYNFDRIRTDYYRDSTVALEAFKAGDYDIRPENESKKWATGYDFPAVAEGAVKLAAFPNQRPTGMQAYAFNLRRPLFQDARVRRALIDAFDFEWANKTLFYSQYERTRSYFSNSELASSGLPGKDELAFLDPLRGQVPEALFDKPYVLPSTDPPGSIRDNLRQAAQLLKEAGWVVRDDKLVDARTGQPFAFEILLDEPAWERITLPFADNLKRLGITATVRTVDSSQYEQRVKSFDFDMIVTVWGESESPGNEQREFWGSASADAPGSRNVVGVRNKAVDRLIDAVIAAPDRAQLVTRVHALDRVLLWNDYVIPHWHLATDRVAYWDKFGMPKQIPSEGVQFMAWWYDLAKAAAIAKH